MTTITPHLWYDKEAEEAANLYTSIFDDSEIIAVRDYGDGWPGTETTVMTVTFRIKGQEVIALNAGPHFRFNEAFSFFVECESQEEVDRYWEQLIQHGGQESQCGWLRDRFGLSWQIVPKRLDELMLDEDPKKARAVMEAMLQMKKIEVAELEEAYANA